MNPLFQTIINIILAFFFMTLGIFGLIIPLDSTTRTAAVEFIFGNSIAIMIFGFAFFSIGLAITISLFFNFKKKHYHVHSRRYVIIDEAIIQNYINSYWRQTYPAYDIDSHLTIKKNKIYLFVDFPYISKEQHKNFLENIRADLSDQFARILGYQDDFHLFISFRSH